MLYIYIYIILYYYTLIFLIHSCILTGQTKSKFTELDETHKLVDRLLSVAQRLKSNIDLLRSTGSVSWSAIWQFLKLNDAVDIVDVESRLSHETEKLKADYAQLLKKQD